MKVVTFLRKNRETAKRVVDFPRERDTSQNKTLEIGEDFASESIFSFFFLFSSFFFIFFIFLLFSFFSFFIFLHFLSFSFILFHFLSFSFSLLGAQKSFFLGLNFVTISVDCSHVKNQFLGPSRVVRPLWTLFSFFPTFFLPFLIFFLAF